MVKWIKPEMMRCDPSGVQEIGSEGQAGRMKAVKMNDAVGLDLG